MSKNTNNTNDKIVNVTNETSNVQDCIRNPPTENLRRATHLDYLNSSQRNIGQGFQNRIIPQHNFNNRVMTPFNIDPLLLGNPYFQTKLNEINLNNKIEHEAADLKKSLAIKDLVNVFRWPSSAANTNQMLTFSNKPASNFSSYPWQTNTFGIGQSKFVPFTNVNSWKNAAAAPNSSFVPTNRLMDNNTNAPNVNPSSSRNNVVTLTESNNSLHMKEDGSTTSKQPNVQGEMLLNFLTYYNLFYLKNI